MKKFFKCMLLSILVITLVFIGGCRQSDRINYNIGVQADNFNVYRRLTVINARTDTILLTMEGTFSLDNNDTSELEIIVEVEEGKYQKHFVYLNEYTLYVVEDITGADVSKYHYEINFLPQMIPIAVPTMED